MSDRKIFALSEKDRWPMRVEACEDPASLYVWARLGCYLTRNEVVQLRDALTDWLDEAEPTEPTDRDVERDAQVAEMARAVIELGSMRDHLHGRIDRLAARINTLETDAAQRSPLASAIADEIRRAAGR